MLFQILMRTHKNKWVLIYYLQKPINLIERFWYMIKNQNRYNIKCLSSNEV